MFDLTNLPKQENKFEPVPEGIYPVVVEGGEWKISKTNPQNEYLNLKIRITGDNYGNRIIFTMLNLINTNEVARNIALHDLKSMYLAMGVSEDKLKLTKEQIVATLLGKPFGVKLIIKENGQWGMQNVIKEYRCMTPTTTAAFSVDQIPF